MGKRLLAEAGQLLPAEAGRPKTLRKVIIAHFFPIPSVRQDCVRWDIRTEELIELVSGGVEEPHFEKNSDKNWRAASFTIWCFAPG